MTGSVIALNPSTGLIVVRTDQDDYSVIELIGGHDVEIGDEIVGKLHEEGSGVIRNSTQCESMDVIIQGVFGTKREALRLIS